MRHIDLENYINAWEDADAKTIAKAIVAITGETPENSGVVRHFNAAVMGRDVKDDIVRLAVLQRLYFEKTGEVAAKSAENAADSAEAAADSAELVVTAREKIDAIWNVAMEESARNLWRNGDVTTDSEGGFIGVPIDELEPGTYTLSMIVDSNADGTKCNVGVARDNFAAENRFAFWPVLRGTRVRHTFEITTEAVETIGGKPNRIYLYAGANSEESAGKTAHFRDIQLEAGDAATAYEPGVTAKDRTARRGLVTPTGNTTDRKADIENALAVHGECVLAEGTYYVSNIVMPPETRLRGAGKGTRLIMTDGTVGGCITLNRHTDVCDLSILGQADNLNYWEKKGPADADTTDYERLVAALEATDLDLTTVKCGIIRVDSDALLQATVSNVRLANFNGAGIYLDNLSTTSNINVCCDNVFVNDCVQGIHVGEISEFGMYNNVNCNRCIIGAVVHGGNNLFTGCHFDRNYLNLRMGDKNRNNPATTRLPDGIYQNNSHGTFSACTFHHAGYGGQAWDRSEDDPERIVVPAIEIHSMTIGEIFIGCQVGYGSILINKSRGLWFSGCWFSYNRGNNGGGIRVTDSVSVRFGHCNMQNEKDAGVWFNDKCRYCSAEIASRSTGKMIVCETPDITEERREAGKLEGTRNLFIWGDQIIDPASGVQAYHFPEPLPAGDYVFRCVATSDNLTSVPLVNVYNSDIMTSDTRIKSFVVPRSVEHTERFHVDEPIHAIYLQSGETQEVSRGYSASFRKIQLTQGGVAHGYTEAISAVDSVARADIINDDIVDYGNRFTTGKIAFEGVGEVVPAKTAASKWKCAVIPCADGDRFSLRNFTIGRYRWAFADADNKVITRTRNNPGTAAKDAWFTPEIVVAPSKATTLIVNHYDNDFGYLPEIKKLSASNVVNYLAEQRGELPWVPEGWKRYVVCAYDRYLARKIDHVIEFSDDCGATWTGGVDVTAIETAGSNNIIEGYHFYADGTLAFFTRVAAYYADFGAETYSKAACYEADGENEFVPGVGDNFRINRDYNERKWVDGIDLFVWGNYDISDPQDGRRILLWYSKDRGRSYRIAHEFNKGGDYFVRHVHLAYYYEPEDVYILCTGDSGIELKSRLHDEAYINCDAGEDPSENMVLSAAYDADNESWSITKLGGGVKDVECLYKWAGLQFWGGWLYYSHDVTPGAVRRCRYADIGDISKHETLLSDTSADCTNIAIGPRGDMIAVLSNSRSAGGDARLSKLGYKHSVNLDARRIFYSPDRQSFYEVWMQPQIADSYSFPHRAKPVTADGHLIMCAMHDGYKDLLPSIYVDEIVRRAGFPDAFKPIK